MGFRIDIVGPATPGVLVVRAAVVAIGFYLAGALSLALSIDGGTVVPIWLASGVALAGVLAWGRWMALGALVGNVAVSLTVADLSLPLSIGIAVGDAAEVLLAAVTVLAIGETLAFSHARCVLGLAVAAPVSAAIAASVAIVLLAGAGQLALDMERAWVRYWLSTVTGMVVITPFLLAWLRDGWRRPSTARAVEAAALIAVIMVSAVGMYARESWNFLELLFMLPVFSWAVVRFGTRGATGANVLFATVLGYGVLEREIPLTGLGLSATVDVMQVLLAMLSIANLVIAATLNERRDAIVELKDLLDAFNHSQRIANVGSWELPLDGSRRIWCSKELCRMIPVHTDATGTASLDELLGTTEGLDRKRLAQAVDHAVESGRPLKIEHRVRDTDRALHHVAAVVPADGDRPARIVGSVVDVSSQRAMERFQDDLIATASHELRTPLTSIVGFADTLLGGWHALDESRRVEFVGIISDQAHRLERIVEDTLLQSRVEAGALDPRIRPFLVGRSVRQALENVDMPDVETRVASGLMAVGDAEQFVQVLENLLTNARKYGKPPYSIVARERGDKLVELRVDDHGPGLAPAFGPRAFERFARGPDVGTAPGTGLGLSITRGMLEAVGGTIHHERWNGVTSFVVRLPVARNQSTAIAEGEDLIERMRTTRSSKPGGGRD